MTPDFGPWSQAAALIAGTFASEDATCIAAGLLIRAKALAGPLGVAACTLGIFLGDLGLWLVGRLLGRRALKWSWVQRRLPANRVAQLVGWLDRRGWTAVLAARFLPGTRLPVYLAAGMFGRRTTRFIFGALMAAALWTPLLVMLVAWYGDAALRPIQHWLGRGWVSYAGALLVLWTILAVLLRLTSPTGRAQLKAAVARLWRWEFWPAWLFYLPLIPWIGYLAVRHRGLMTPTAANPGIVPHGGVVGESKSAILANLPQQWVVPFVLLEEGPLEQRVDVLQRAIRNRNWSFPLILKPDAGQRGSAVQLVDDWTAARRYLQSSPNAVQAQVYHSGPFEAGVFYYRLPGAARGRIFSITDKHFPELIGDGKRSVAELIWQHPRYCMQARTFLSRVDGQADRVLNPGERLPLTFLGNHCQGTQFRDGGHLITGALEAAIDQIARQFEGFYFGRFDIRYSDPRAFQSGREFAIVELNGVTSESTNLYDPDRPLWRAYRLLFQQWALLFKIGAANQRRGYATSSLAQVLADARTYYQCRRRRDNGNSSRSAAKTQAEPASYLQ